MVLARQLGRPEEKISVYTLEKLPVKDVDMLSILLIGNSCSAYKDHYFVTPRGYPGVEMC